MVKSLGGLPPDRFATAFVLLASGVGNNPDAVAPVRGADGRSGYAVPDSVIPERGQLSENSSMPGTKEAWHVFHNCKAGSNLANKSGELRPQTRSFTFDASSLASI
jgi:hypothetical protein